MIVCEIFEGIQGESSRQGLPSTFVRLTGCNLRCNYCDTLYAFSGGTEMTVGEVIGKVRSLTPVAVCVTGGEPLLQNEAFVLIESLCDEGYSVSVETNGSIDASTVDRRAARVFDVKCPSSGIPDPINPANLESIRPNDEFKFVLCDRGDFLYASEFLRRHDLSGANAVLFSPATGHIDPAELAGWIIHETPGARLNLQLHRYIWPDRNRGV